MFHGIQIVASLVFAAAALTAQPVSVTAPPMPSVKSSYLLGPGDQVTVRVAEAEEIPDHPLRIDDNGDPVLPMVGRVRAGGLSVGDLQALLARKFQIFIREPQVVVLVNETRSQPVSVLGAVTTPGVHQLQGRKTLVEVLAAAGGLRVDAGYRVKITRQPEWGAIPLAGATTDPATRCSVAEVPVKGLLEAVGPADNIEVLPNDVITVPVAEMVYVLGDVKKSGGFVLGQRTSVSVLQALAMAEGLAPMARAGQARILRTERGTQSRIEIPVDLTKIMSGKAGDVLMLQNDILFVPTNTVKRLGARSLDAMFGIGTGMAVYRP